MGAVHPVGCSLANSVTSIREVGRIRMGLHSLYRVEQQRQGNESHADRL